MDATISTQVSRLTKLAPMLEELLLQKRAPRTVSFTNVGDDTIESLFVDLDVAVSEAGSIGDLLRQHNVPITTTIPPAFRWSTKREEEQRDRYMQHLRDHYPLPPPWAYGQIPLSTTQSTPHLSGCPDVVVLPNQYAVVPALVRFAIVVKQYDTTSVSDIYQAIATHAAVAYHAGARPSFTFLTDLRTYWAVFYFQARADGRRQLTQRLTRDLAVAATMYQQVIQIVYRHTVRALTSVSHTLPVSDHDDNDDAGGPAERTRRASRLQQREPLETQQLDLNISFVYARKRMARP